MLEQLNIYPNPATSGVRVELPFTPAQNTQLSITNLSGQEVLRRELTEAITELDINSLNAGIYFLRVQSNNGLVTQKLVVQ